MAFFYSFDTNSTLVGYCDADWLEIPKTRNVLQVVGYILVITLSLRLPRKKKFVSLMLAEYDVQQDVMILYCDNVSAIKIFKNLV